MHQSAAAAALRLPSGEGSPPPGARGQPRASGRASGAQRGCCRARALSASCGAHSQNCTSSAWRTDAHGRRVLPHPSASTPEGETTIAARRGAAGGTGPVTEQRGPTATSLPCTTEQTHRPSRQLQGVGGAASGPCSGAPQMGAGATLEEPRAGTKLVQRASAELVQRASAEPAQRWLTCRAGRSLPRHSCRPSRVARRHLGTKRLQAGYIGCRLGTEGCRLSPVAAARAATSGAKKSRSPHSAAAAASAGAKPQPRICSGCMVARSLSALCGALWG